MEVPTALQKHAGTRLDPFSSQAVTVPASNSKPPMADPTPRFGFVEFAETWNGRMAMMGFVIGLATELLTGQGILQQIGLG
jgi:ferrochelatase